MVLALIPWEALRWWSGKRGDGLASTTAWEALFLLSLYQMTQSLPLVPGQVHLANKQ